MSRVARTLLAGQVVNLTGREIWAYGTSGELFQLEAAELRADEDGQLPPPEEGTYYVVDLNSDAAIRRDERYRPCLLLAKYMGDGLRGEAIYNLLLAAGEDGRMKVTPITEMNGRPGEIVVYNDYTTSKRFMASIRRHRRVNLA